jgi:chlorite dismutase
VEYTAPDFDPPYRVLVLIASTDGWYRAGTDERDEATDELARLLQQTEAEGARLLSSFDDDLFLTGQPAPLPYSIFVHYDVDDLGVIVRLVHRMRISPLSRLLRLEARVGRPLFVLDQ